MAYFAKGIIYDKDFWERHSASKKFYLLLVAILSAVIAYFAYHAILLLLFTSTLAISLSTASFIAFLAAALAVYTVFRLLTLNFGHSDFFKMWNKAHKNWGDRWYIIASILGLGVGITFCAYLWPFMMVWLAPSAWAIPLALVACAALINATCELLLLPNLLYSMAMRTASAWKKSQDEDRTWLGIVRVLGISIAIATSIYLAVLIFHPLGLALAMPHGLAVLAALAISIGLATTCCSLILKATAIVTDMLEAGLGRKEVSAPSPQVSVEKPTPLAAQSLFEILFRSQVYEDRSLYQGLEEALTAREKSSYSPLPS